MIGQDREIGANSSRTLIIKCPLWVEGGHSANVRYGVESGHWQHKSEVTFSTMLQAQQKSKSLDSKPFQDHARSVFESGHSERTQGYGEPKTLI